MTQEHKCNKLQSPVHSSRRDFLKAAAALQQGTPTGLAAADTKGNLL
jgi:hypothetical protein